MKDSLLSLFPAAEYERRLERIVAQMHERGIDALILTSDENTYYFSGLRSIVWCSKVSTPGVMPTSGCPGVRECNCRNWRSSSMGRS